MHATGIILENAFINIDGRESDQNCYFSSANTELAANTKIVHSNLWNCIESGPTPSEIAWKFPLKLHMYKAHAPRASPLRMLDPWLSLYRSKHQYIEIFYFMQFRRAIYAISERTGMRFHRVCDFRVCDFRGSSVHCTTSPDRQACRWNFSCRHDVPSECSHVRPHMMA